MIRKNISSIQSASAAVLLLIAAALSGSCSGGPTAQDAAKGFLDAYLSADFNKAADYCTVKLSGDLKEALKEIESLSEPLKLQISSSAGRFSSRIEEVKKKGKGDTVTVYYSITETFTDSTLHPGSEIIKSTLSVIKDSTGTWKVAKLNK